jgi:hypothetical protein
LRDTTFLLFDTGALGGETLLLFSDLLRAMTDPCVPERGKVIGDGVDRVRGVDFPV